MIGTMVKNRPRTANNLQDPGVTPWGMQSRVSREVNPVRFRGERQTTLVLAPASLLQQWYEEVTEKTQPGLFRVHIHHGKDKLKEVKQLESYDVIITSYHTLLMDVPKRTDKEDDDRQPGPLIRVRWLRVVIDEAQNIRNKWVIIISLLKRTNALGKGDEN